MGGAVSARRSDGSLMLGIYLNDHFAGATAGLELARRASGEHRGSDLGSTLDRLFTEISLDRQSLLRVMESLGVPVRRYKTLGAWMIERAGRLKPNGRVWRRSPLSTLIELEALRLGVQGKELLWRTLITVSAQDPRLDADRLGELLDRAQEQSETLDALHRRAAATLFTGSAVAGAEG